MEKEKGIFFIAYFMSGFLCTLMQLTPFPFTYIWWINGSISVIAEHLWDNDVMSENATLLRLIFTNNFIYSVFYELGKRWGVMLWW